MQNTAASLVGKIAEQHLHSKARPSAYFPTPYFCILLSVSFLSDRIMQLFRWEQICICAREREKREGNQELDCVFIQHGISPWNSRDASKDRISSVLIKLTGLFIKKTYTFMGLCSFKPIYFNQKGLMGCEPFFQSINLLFFFLRETGRDTSHYPYLFLFLSVAAFIVSCIACSSGGCHNHSIRSNEFIPG